MNYASPPSADDIAVIAEQIAENLPDEISELSQKLVLQVEEFPDETIEAELEIENPYELLALYRSSREIAPGVEKKVAHGEDRLLLFRRPILDLWCETGDDLSSLVREVVIEEIARTHEFSESDIQSMLKRHHEGML